MSHAVLAPRIQAPTLSRRSLRALGAWAVGVVTLALLARISIALPGTPVPLTGQTFGVALAALLGGRRLGSAIVAGYLGLAFTGWPVLAHGASVVNGATAGYLVGMMVASVIVGACADLGWTRSWPKAFAAASLGSAATFAVGLFVLDRFVPRESLLAMGLYPFLLGDLLKNVSAATLARAVTPTHRSI